MAAAARAVNVPRLAEICLVFGAASLMSFGGGNSIVPHLQAETVQAQGWLSAAAFADAFAIAQVAPGPSVLLVTLLGYDAAGLTGALLATVSMLLPASLLVGLVARGWQASGKARWHTALERGMAPIGVGLVAASGLVVADSVDREPLFWAISACAALALAATRINPLIVLSTAGLAAWAGG